MAQTTYQIMIFFRHPRASAFVGWFNGDMVEQAIAAAISAARESGHKLNIRTIEIITSKRQRGEA